MHQQQNDIDSQLKRLADEAESGFHDSSWMKMEKLLDKKEKRKAIWWYWPLGLAISLLVLASIFYFIDTPSNQYTSSTIAQNSSPKELFSGNTSGASNAELIFTAKNLFNSSTSASFNSSMSISGNGAKSSQSYNSNSENIAESHSGAINSLEKTSTIINKNSNPNYQILSNKSNAQKKGFKESGNKRIASNNLNNTYSITSETNSINNQAHTDQKSETDEVELKKSSMMASSNSTLQSDHQPIRGVVFASLLPQIFNLYSLHQPKKSILTNPFVFNAFPPKKVKHSALILSAHSSPEWTAVPSRKYGKISTEYGAGLGVKLGRHWSIYSGWQQTNKLYRATGDDYAITKGTYWDGKLIFDINAECKVTEWPILIGYQVPIYGGYLGFSLGTASLKMDKESYDYTFAYSSGAPHRHRTLLFEDKNWEWFAAGIIGINYIKPIGKNFSFSIGPYFKTPLKGVGQGTISLQSLGGQIGLNYTLVKF